MDWEFASKTVYALTYKGQAVMPFDTNTIIYFDFTAYNKNARGAGYANMQLVKVKDMPFQTAVRVNTTSKPPYEYSVRLDLPSKERIDKNDIVLVSFWANLVTKSHNVIWENDKKYPDDVAQMIANKNGAALEKRLNGHIKDVLDMVGGKVQKIDLVNEPIYNSIEGILPSKADAFNALMKYMVDNGAPFDGIGIQGHFYTAPVEPETQLKNFDRLATYGKTVAISEFSYTCKDKELQADFTRDFYIAAFSHPAIDEITMWGFRDGNHFDNDAPIFYKNWTLKPSGREYMDLVFNKWWTDETGAANGDGVFATRGVLWGL